MVWLPENKRLMVFFLYLTHLLAAFSFFGLQLVSKPGAYNFLCAWVTWVFPGDCAYFINATKKCILK